ncbi:hypothetical protein [Mesorhizobium sp. L-8-3]|uniref:hypothetical protein n=1 Tax=Mesorhizobium sp. L-8-3 TaxID=2744522 RepID=UPI0019268C5C|nr:hypothetical protein [Mesorhizobium sp. L-8-3]BCH22470.1 hypothetical protein MesoLjLb_22550 [Mesorhizobium sp. L-8-3]
MALTIRLSTDMSVAEMTPLWPDVIACLERYCRRFGTYETVSNIVRECAQGRRQLWLVFDEAGQVILTPITEIVTIDATGKKQLLLAEVGGRRLRECMPLLKEIEEWAAREHGTTECQLVGRKGWKKLLEPLGYAEAAVIWRKGL